MIREAGITVHDTPKIQVSDTNDKDHGPSRKQQDTAMAASVRIGSIEVKAIDLVTETDGPITIG